MKVEEPWMKLFKLHIHPEVVVMRGMMDHHNVVMNEMEEMEGGARPMHISPMAAMRGEMMDVVDRTMRGMRMEHERMDMGETMKNMTDVEIDMMIEA